MRVLAAAFPFKQERGLPRIPRSWEAGFRQTRDRAKSKKTNGRLFTGGTGPARARKTSTRRLSIMSFAGALVGRAGGQGR